jgi:hypothetical protein
MHRAVFLPPKRLRGVIVHPNYFTGGQNLDRQTGPVMLGEFRFDHVRLANQDYAHPKFSCSQHTSFDFGTGRMVPSHRVHSNCDHGVLLSRLPGFSIVDQILK